MIAEVAFNIPLDRTFHYRIPPSLEPAARPGVRVAAPFGPRERIGFVLRVLAQSPIRELKDIRRAIDPVPVIADERWELARWLSAYYYCSLGEALAAMVPSGLRLRMTVPVSDTDQQSATWSVSDTGMVLTSHQQRAFEAVRQALDDHRSTRLLLHGVTGSGKTEIYLRAIEHALRLGRSAICLIPEIALTAQTIDRFVERFGDQVAVWHSRVSTRRRAEEWARLSRGERRIVVGARSAVFAPVQRLGLVIIDEEHETTYKQEDVPRYHARDVACARARATGAAVVLGSATPSVETYYAAARRGGRLLALPERIRGRGLPAVEIVDMRREMAKRRGSSPLSGRLARALEETVERGEQAMLLLNRRGFARISQCRACGFVERCPRCSVPLVYHASHPGSSPANAARPGESDRRAGGAGRQMLCHYCNFSKPPQEVCPQCKKDYLRFRGTGTERVESELHRLFPVAAIGRMDRDTTAGRHSHRELYEAVKTGRITLLVGTQMIAKGFDFPGVTLVGVVSADTALNLPDFRAGERTFDLLTQVAGRAGRGEQPGRVLLQTYCPTHYAIQAAKTHDYEGFYATELSMRRSLRLPPFVRLIELVVLGPSRERAGTSAEALAAILRREAARRFTVLGPAPHRIPRLRRTYRMSLLLKTRSVEAATQVLRTVLQDGRKFGGLPVLVDVDPL